MYACMYKERHTYTNIYTYVYTFTYIYTHRHTRAHYVESRTLSAAATSSRRESTPDAGAGMTPLSLYI